MATYFHGNSEIQPDGLQTLILMNPGYVGYSDAQQPGNFVFLNSAAGNSLSQANPPPTQQLVGIPLQAQTSGGTSSASQDPYHQSMHPQHHEISALHGFVPRGPYNLWNSVEPVARETPRAQQGLSLSLSSQQPGYGGSFRAERELPSQASAPTNGEDMRISAGSASSVSGISNGVSGIQSVLLSSKYLKAAQQLLDQVVNVGNGIKTDHVSRSTKMIGESSAAAIRDGSIDGETSARSGTDLSTAEKQEIRMKKAKLVTMLDEVEQRYRQYHHQMQIVISTFEQAAGIGSARTYTALALQTISKQFRCLKDAILGQIRAANKSLGEEDSLGGKMEGSKLKFVDHHLRQQRALQQLGMIQHSAWRPQRGLPERSVSVLRAWLFEHFLHPYPKDSDKHMLAKQTGLTRSQVSNWFINARVRLWKPMVEEMYLEELKDQDRNASPDKTNSKSEHNEDSVSKSSALQDKSPVRDNNRSISFKAKQDFPTNQNVTAISTSTTSPIGGNLGNQSGFTLIGSQELDGFTQGSPKKQRSTKMLDFSNNVPSIDHMVVKHDEASNEHHSMKFGSIDQDHNRGGFSFMGGPTNFIEGFGSYPIGEIGRFDTEQFHQRYSGNGVSLTLGLPDCENLSLSGTHQSFLPNQSIHLGRRVEMGERNDFGAINTPTPSHTTTGYENISIQNGKRFAAQLLPDFVA